MIQKILLSQSYNKVERHDYEIEDYVDQQAVHQLIMLLLFKAKPIEPFKKTEFLKKSSYWKLSDFNFNYLPSNISL
jgi:cell surface protein SprA